MKGNRTRMLAVLLAVSMAAGMLSMTSLALGSGAETDLEEELALQFISEVDQIPYPINVENMEQAREQIERCLEMRACLEDDRELYELLYEGFSDALWALEEAKAEYDALLATLPVPTPTPEVTEEPTPEPTPKETAEPTPAPTPTAEATSTPAPEVTAEPTVTPIPEATVEPTSVPTPDVTVEPSPSPTPEETMEPAPEITAEPMPSPVPETTAEPMPSPVPETTAEPTPAPVPETTKEPAPIPTSEATTESTSTTKTPSGSSPVSSPTPTPELETAGKAGVSAQGVEQDISSLLHFIRNSLQKILSCLLRLCGQCIQWN